MTVLLHSPVCLVQPSSSTEKVKAVALGSQLHVVGALEQHGLLQVAALVVHVCHAVLAVVCDVLAGLVGQQAHEGQLCGHALVAQSLVVVGELSASIDGLSEPDVLLGLSGSVPVLLSNAAPM